MPIEAKCGNCIFGDIAVKEGDPYTFMNPHGEEVVRVHQQTVLLCRAMPPIAGQWPQVLPEDWCGHFQPEQEENKEQGQQ